MLVFREPEPKIPTRVSGYNISLFDQTELIAQISKSIRAGNYTADIKASKIVLVGHSFGSITTNSVLANYGDIVDGMFSPSNPLRFPLGARELLSLPVSRRCSDRYRLQ